MVGRKRPDATICQEQLRHMRGASWCLGHLDSAPNIDHDALDLSLPAGPKRKTMICTVTLCGEILTLTTTAYSRVCVGHVQYPRQPPYASPRTRVPSNYVSMLR